MMAAPPELATPELAATVPLEQLWMRIPRVSRQELLRQWTRILAQRLAPSRKGEADE